MSDEVGKEAEEGERGGEGTFFLEASEVCDTILDEALPRPLCLGHQTHNTTQEVEEGRERSLAHGGESERDGGKRQAEERERERD